MFKIFFKKPNKMIRHNYLILLLLAIPIITYGQQLLTTSGGYMTNSKTEANWSIGEVITETSSANETSFTSGLNQPILNIETLVENIERKLSITISPNPTSQFINIKYIGQLPIKAKLLLLNGVILFNVELKNETSQLDLSKIENGIYIIEITDQVGNSNIYKIVKQ
jgi:hypothetical protein